MSALSISSVGHSFGQRVVLRNVSFEVSVGEFAVLVGRNGAGKTTLLSLICGLYWPRHGSISVFGSDIAADPISALATMGIVFQRPTLDLDLSIAENLRYHGALHGMSPHQAQVRAREELARAELGTRSGDKVRELSGGERRRVELARAMLARPRLLVLDEPTVGLDPEARQDLLSRVRGLCRENDVTVLWATHLLDEISPDDKVLRLEDGRSVESRP